MNYVFILDSNDYSHLKEFANVEGYITEYYKILKKLIPLSYKKTIKIICDENSVSLFNDLPVSSIFIRENKNILSNFEIEDVLINCKDITDSKEDLREFLKITYPKNWIAIVNNLNARFL